MSRSLTLPAGYINDYVYDDDSGTSWADIECQIQPNSNGPNAPSFTSWSVQGSASKFYGYLFNSGALNSVKQCYANLHIPHTYSVKNSGVYVHLHLVNHVNQVVSAPNNVVRFLVECSYATSEGVWSAVQSQTIIFDYPSNQGFIHMIRETTNPFFAGVLEPDALVTIQITRDKGNATDTCDQDVILLFVDGHIEVGKFGTLYRNKAIGGSFYG